MARVTIEKCLKQGIKDKFDLVLVASKRAKDIEKGKKPVVTDKVKNTLISLMEIEQDKLDIEQIKSEVVAKYRKYGVELSDVGSLNEEEVYNNLISLGSEEDDDVDNVDNVDDEDTVTDLEDLDEDSVDNSGEPEE